MKKQIMSLILLAAVVISTNAASAKQGEDFRTLTQSDVPDNMLSKIGQSDVPDNLLSLQPGFDDCTVQELSDGSCVMNLYSNMTIVTNVQPPQGKSFWISVDQNCPTRGEIQVRIPNQYLVNLNGSAKFSEAGRYQIINNSFTNCSLKIELAK